MDEMNNNNQMNNTNEMNWFPTENKPQAPEQPAEQPIFSATPIVDNTAAPAQPNNSFAYNDNPNQSQNGTYYNYTPGFNGGMGGFSEPLAPLDNSAAQAKAKRSMILGIIAAGLISTCACFPVSIILGIIAIVNASKAKKLSITGNMPGMAIPGLICGIYGLVMSALVIFYFAFMIFLLIVGEADSSTEAYLSLRSLL